MLIAATGPLWLAVAGALVMGTGFSLSFPSLALLVVEEVDEDTRGAAMGAFTAFFDVGVGIGGPLAGAVSAVAGYPAAFLVGAACAAARRRGRRQPIFLTSMTKTSVSFGGIAGGEPCAP